LEEYPVDWYLRMLKLIADPKKDKVILLGSQKKGKEK
jgi:hypothetical protein